jgi:hypothetical protein
LPKTTNKLYWRGNDHLGRKDILNSLNDVLNDDHTNRVSLQEYYEEIASHQIALSLPGLGKSCHREYECFAIGTVVVSPKFQNTNHAPLIPDHHYLAVDNPAQIRDKIAMTTQLELCAIRLNAMRYYDEYLRYESSLKWLWHLLEL